MFRCGSGQLNASVALTLFAVTLGLAPVVRADERASAVALIAMVTFFAKGAPNGRIGAAARCAVHADSCAQIAVLCTGVLAAAAAAGPARRGCAGSARA